MHEDPTPADARVENERRAASSDGQKGRAFDPWSIELGELDRKMGVEVEEQSAERIVATMPVEGNRQSLGLLHGGASVALGEMLGGARAGEVWTPEDGWKFLRHNVAMAEGTLRFEWLRYMGWPGQAPSYRIGLQMWLDAREQAMAREGEDFDLKRFHSRALRLGSVGLDTLTYALAL